MKMMTRATRHRADQKNPCGFGSDLSNFSDTAIAMLKNRFIAVVFALLLAPYSVFADGWDSSKASHQTIYADTITSKTDANPVTVADSQGLYVTGNLGVGVPSPSTPLAIRGNGGAFDIGITQNQVGGFATMELTTADGSA